MTDRIPDGFVLARTTDAFDNHTVPAGLLKAHRVAEASGLASSCIPGRWISCSGDDPDAAATGERRPDAHDPARSAPPRRTRRARQLLRRVPPPAHRRRRRSGEHRLGVDRRDGVA